MTRRILSILASKSRRAENGEEPIKEHSADALLQSVPRHQRRHACIWEDTGDSGCVLKLVGVIPEDHPYCARIEPREPERFLTPLRDA